MTNEHSENNISIFISYSNKDKRTALAIDQWLRNKGARVMIDERDFGIGEDIEDEIVRCIKQAGKVVCIYSKYSVNRLYVKLERRIATSLEHGDAQGASKRLIYFCIDNEPLPVEAKPRLAIKAKGLSFSDACEKLWHGILGVAPEPREIDLTQFQDISPWEMLDSETVFRRSKKELDTIFAEFLTAKLSPSDRVRRVEWLSEGPLGESKAKLQQILEISSKFSQAELRAAEMAFDDLRSGRQCKNLLKRVEAEVPKTEIPEDAPKDALVGIAAVGVLQAMIFWERPESKNHKDAYDMLLKLASGKKPRER